MYRITVYEIKVKTCIRYRVAGLFQPITGVEAISEYLVEPRTKTRMTTFISSKAFEKKLKF